MGPFQPTATDTKKADEPFFAYIAKALGADYDVQVSSDWAGLATALANDRGNCTKLRNGLSCVVESTYLGVKGGEGSH